jgi:ATP-dependent DNA helicase RecG
MRYSEEDLKVKLSELRSLSAEDEVVEFKEANDNYDFKKIGKYVSALSNEANLRNTEEAWLVFGIKDVDHQLNGTNFRIDPNDLMSLKEEIANATNERFTFKEIYPLTVEGLRIIMFCIPPAPRGIPIGFKGHFYARDNEALVPLNIEKLDRIRAQATRVDWSYQIVERASLEDLNSEAIEFARSQYVVKFPHRKSDIASWDDAKFLDKAKITIRGKITRTALILLGDEESEHFLNPSEIKIRWKLLNDAGDSLGYEIIHMPLILGVEQLFNKIRILKYRYIPEGSLFPEEVDTYDSFSIREALNNCIAHQDYQLGGRINVIERSKSLTFTNKGVFLPKSVEDVVAKDVPEETYRNPHLVAAMYNLNMVDTEGGGIKKMFGIQAKKYFPLPEYDLRDSRISVTLTGKVLDMRYASLLARNKDLTLTDIILLDKIQKSQEELLSDIDIKYLRKKMLVEGRKGRLYLSKSVAQKTGQKARYSNLSGLNKEHYKTLILKSIEEHGSMLRKEIDELIMNKLPDAYKDAQRKNLVMNLIQELRKEGKIKNSGSRTKSNWIRM